MPPVKAPAMAPTAGRACRDVVVVVVVVVEASRVLVSGDTMVADCRCCCWNSGDLVADIEAEEKDSTTTTTVGASSSCSSSRSDILQVDFMVQEYCVFALEAWTEADSLFYFLLFFCELTMMNERWVLANNSKLQLGAIVLRRTWKYYR